MEVQYQYIKTKREGHVFHLILSRPEKRNAFTPATISEIAHVIEQINQDDKVTVMVLSAEGPVFCAGMDLKVFRGESQDKKHEDIPHREVSLGEVFAKLHKPSIAVVEGDVIAGGFLYVLGCTYVFAKPGVRFKLPELELGIFPFQVMASLLKVLPEKKVLQLCLNTDYFSVEEAFSYGIVDNYFDKESYENLLSRFATAKSSILKAGYESIRSLPNMHTDEQYDFLKQVLNSVK